MIFQQLREAILKKIRILEAGINVNLPNTSQHGTSSTVTSQFLTQTQGRQTHLPKSNIPVKRKCTYCKGHHPSYHNVVTDCQQRWSIIKKGQTLFQLSGEPKVYHLPVKVPLPQMQGEHHTSRPVQVKTYQERPLLTLRLPPIALK